ncbi:GDP-L-fucose synthase [bacterium HR37]|nr:GDP-L-fucose synthase [bacterium HR37]
MKRLDKIYVAGHRGLVGSSIKRRLDFRGYGNLVFKTSAELDLRRQRETESFFEKEKPDYVFLAAAKVGGILANDTYRAEFIYDNIMIAANVIHSAYRYGVKKLLNLGSSCIYPKFAPQPLKEDYLLTGGLEPTNEPYAIAKISAIKLCRYYNEQYGTNFISVMPTNLYGPNDNFNLETAHVLPALIRKFHLAKLLRKRDFPSIVRDVKRYRLGFGIDGKINYEDEDSLTLALKKLGITRDYVLLWGSGEVYREFLYVDDLSDACIFLIENYDYRDIGEFINIGVGEDIKVKELAGIIRDIVGFEGDIRHDLSKPDGTPRKLLDVSRIRKLGWEPKVGLKEGLTLTYNWYLEQTK